MRFTAQSPKASPKAGAQRRRLCSRPVQTIAAGVLLAAVACGSAGAQEQDVVRHMRLIREKTGELCSLLLNHQAEVLAEGKTSRLQQAYSRYGYLLTPAKIAEVEQAIAQAPDSVLKQEWRATPDILRLLAARYQVAEMADGFADAMAQRGVDVDGREVYLRNLERSIALEADRNVRRKIWLAGGDLSRLARVYQHNMMLQLDRNAQDLGADGYYPLLARVEGWNLDLIPGIAEHVLAATDPSYEHSLDSLAAHALGLELRQLRTFDLARLMVLPDLAKPLSDKKLKSIVERTMKDIGLDLGKQRTLKLDLGDEKGRIPGAWAHPHPPGRGLVTMAPGGQLTDAPDLLGAVGAAQFYFLMPGDLSLEDTYAGTNVYPSVFRALLEMIAEEPAWIERNLEPVAGVEPQEIARGLALRRLYQARLAAGRFTFQLRLQHDPETDPATYSELMEPVLKCDLFDSDEQAYFFANDEYRSAGLLMGYIMAAQIRAALRAEWGDDWFQHDELAERLTRASAEGHGMPLDQFLAHWGVDGLDPQLFIGEFAGAPGELSAHGAEGGSED